MRVQNKTTKSECDMPDEDYKTKLEEEMEEIWMVDELITQFIVISAISSSSSTCFLARHEYTISVARVHDRSIQYIYYDISTPE